MYIRVFWESNLHVWYTKPLSQSLYCSQKGYYTYGLDEDDRAKVNYGTTGGFEVHQEIDVADRIDVLRRSQDMLLSLSMKV